MDAPAHLADAARGAWAEVTVGKTIADSDTPAVEAFSVQLARMRAAQAQVDQDGVLLADRDGVRCIPHPALSVEKSASMEMRMWTLRRPDLFGLASSGSTGGAEDPLDELARRRADRLAGTADPVEPAAGS